MKFKPDSEKGLQKSRISRRAALRSGLAGAGAAAVASGGGPARAILQEDARASSPGDARAIDPRKSSPKTYRMKKSINLWAFPYPQRMTLRECLQLAKNAGFDGIELNYDLDNDLSPKSSRDHYRAIRKIRRRDRHRDQRPVLLPLLALLADRQRPCAACASRSNWPA